MKALAVSLIMALSTNAFGGGEGIGGGDPMAREFSDLALELYEYSEARIGVWFDPAFVDAMRDVVTDWERSLNRASQKSLISIVEERPLDDQGVPKAATYNRATSEVRIHRSTWKDMDDYMKLELVAMETFGLIGINFSRYREALIAVNRDGKYIIEKWRRMNPDRRPKKCVPK